MYINTKQLHATAWRSARVIGHNLLHGDAVGQSGAARTGSGPAPRRPRPASTRRPSRAGRSARTGSAEGAAAAGQSGAARTGSGPVPRRRQ